MEWIVPRMHLKIEDVQRAKIMYLFTFKQIVARLIEKDDVISYDGALKMEKWILPRALECTGPDPRALPP